MRKFCLVVLSLVILAGCGGGDDYEDSDGPTTQPVNCSVAPERCR